MKLLLIVTPDPKCRNNEPLQKVSLKKAIVEAPYPRLIAFVILSALVAAFFSLISLL